MTYLLLQTFLLLLSSYFLGALTACLIKRASRRERVVVPAIELPPVPRPIQRAPEPALAPLKVRNYEPLQPKIDILARPEPKAAPETGDPQRFDRVFEHAILKDDVPRKPIVEIRPAVLKPVTPRPGPGAAVPKAQAPKPAPAPAPQPAPKPVAVVTPPPPVAPQQPVQAKPPEAKTPDSVASAAMAAVAAAKAAAASAQTATAVPVVKPVPSPVPAQPQQAAKPVAAAPAPAPTPPPAAVKPPGADDFMRLRAIDETISQRLRALGVGNFEDIARWTPADINRINQALGLGGRIEREQWIEQAQILAKGGETYYSRSRAAAMAAAAVPAAKPAPAPAAAPAPAPAAAPPAAAPAQTVPPVSAGISAAAAAAAAAASALASKSAPAPVQPPAPQQPQPAPQAVAPKPAPAPAAAPTPAPTQSSVSSLPQRSVAEMASAAAAAIAAASASVTRGVRPIEPISPMSKADPNVTRPARLQDAIKEREPKPAESDTGAIRTAPSGVSDDLKRIRGIGVLIEKRLNALGITSYGQIANWTSGDIDRISQTLDFKGRIERENWVEQARILSSGGDTEFSRRVDKGDVESSRDDD